jgi:hypothetical protein
VIVRDVLPLSAYNISRTWSTTRAGTVAGILWAIPMVFYLIRGLHGQVIKAVEIAATGAVVFGLLLAALMRVSVHTFFGRIYQGDRTLVTPPPEGAYDARLLCSVFRGRTAVGGILYLGSKDWVFTPHVRNRRVNLSWIRWERPDRIALSTEPAQLGWLAKLFGARPATRVVVFDGESRRVLVVPDVERVVADLDGYRKKS